MSLVAHLAELAEKHRVLDRRIEQEMARPASTDHEIMRLKLEKLRLKEEIEKLQAQSRPH
ncbi:MAG: YdcH family protein [Hyphomicrobiaceae bacterium]